MHHFEESNNNVITAKSNFWDESMGHNWFNKVQIKDERRWSRCQKAGM